MFHFTALDGPSWSDSFMWRVFLKSHLRKRKHFISFIDQIMNYIPLTEFQFQVKLRVHLLSPCEYEQTEKYCSYKVLYALRIAVYILAHMLPSFHPDLPDRVQAAPAVTQNDDGDAISPCQATQSGPFPLNPSQSLASVSHTPRWQSPPLHCPNPSYVWLYEAVGVKGLSGWAFYCSANPQICQRTG